MDENQHLFDTLKQLADGITNTFGNTCEVAIHDLKNIKKSLVYLTGDVTHRKLGSPVTDAVIKEIVTHGSAVKDRFSFKTITDDGREIKSTTMFIRDDNNDVVAAFCINFDVTDYLNAIQALEIFAGIKSGKQTKKISEKIAVSVDHTFEVLFEEAVGEIGKRPATMSTEEKINLVRILERKGVFQIKGVVNQMALQLGVSSFTVYNYLKKIRAENGVIANNI
jgi:predicted transcriptional regulator YheO